LTTHVALKGNNMKTLPQEINEDDMDIEVSFEDDTPEEDRGREPMPEDIVKELEEDELEQYSGEIKNTFKKYKKVWHDERRAKEASEREKQEAIRVAQALLEENKQLKAKTMHSETALVATYKEAAQRQLKDAQVLYKEAYESGDSEKMLEAQQALHIAQMRANQAVQREQSALQNQKNQVHIEPEQQIEQPVREDPRAVAWRERNPWFGKNHEMTGMVLGLHESLVSKHGLAYTTTEEYYERIDKKMREKFPEEFDHDTQVGRGKPSQSAQRNASIVAPATRSTAPRKVVLTESARRLAQKLGLTDEQYARELVRMEKQNG